MVDVENLCKEALKGINDDENIYTKTKLINVLKHITREGMKEEEIIKSVIQVCLELTKADEPKWLQGASRLYVINLYNEVRKNRNISENEDPYKGFYDFIVKLTDEGLYGKYILENYSKEDIYELESFIKKDRDFLFTYSGIKLLSERYLIQNFERKVLELPQQMFMGIAMHLAVPEKQENRVYWAKRFYDVLSSLKATMATPTMSNARKPFYQLSSCFIDTVDDSLKGIYKSLDNFANVSKYGGGMGVYFGKVRSMGASIRGFKGASGGVVPWVKLFNDTAIAVDQLGVRNGSVAVWLDAWHKDLPEFMQLRTNNGDDRKKAHDVFPGVCYPDLFWRLAEEDIDANWYMMCPHEIKLVKGYSLEDYYGEEWEKRYFDCVNDPRIDKRMMSVKDIVRLIIKSAAETGTPFAFYRDAANRMNPNKHKGMIYSSNLCTEIMQNMSAMDILEDEIIDENGDKIIVQKAKSGDFVVCNLSSIVLGNVDVNDDEELQYVIETQIRAMDNVIDLNYYSVPFAEVTNKRYRGIGLGTSGYHHMLTNNRVVWTSDDHFEFTDRVYEKINYYAIQASMNIAKDKGRYEYFEGSDWENGSYFKLRGYNSPKWKALIAKIKKYGMRNGYIMAVAPNGSTATIAGTSEGVDPVMARFWMEEKKGSITPKIAPNLSRENFWFYNSAYNIDQKLCVKINGIRQRHIDQSQSFNLYITTDYTMRQIMNLYIEAYKSGVKSIYYVRSKSLTVGDCDSCSA
ncbi:ribonucleoside-diphosphate reductase alpha chain [Clostridium acetobutylicum]|uniref:Ribonucleoside-diphosphate reductase n=1 Tax=Clostridium acetobutylicum (strain ATCC 824 / DSM 792 / JCM 1419 / IAM 19013 / LMG 5710 / NBRC 13948 / NRRL B-527 / VKM B-1787 / 2291 / W) TaxID=272562 RepID=Q97E39_CLOAB|nr:MULTISPECIES: ribonucleoside-diphosphate reductase subunit alpha [Clostridium]AAK81211.1 Ribonucleotide reductase alpha subunit [Clostridium acetobutylicum ATCC 824]ADZ22316.1 ribonucleotide-diphosphate reductase subunit alpha [Clostridium acetobutylicum EA 2018]AEI33097.1 ribonucleotide-diphosphate reductase subunit alpha [Clostridium acetobutylicum DSM 1731]AWV81120.1 ribonucleoside-diphosphate reductase subunit alpha [Clostridium acetobutylicum]MBC2395678.1 ribonucleoside-diphosphate red